LKYFHLLTPHCFFILLNAFLWQAEASFRFRSWSQLQWKRNCTSIIMCLVIAPGTKSLRTCVSGRKSRLQMANNKVSCRVSHLSNYTEDFSSFFAFAFAVIRHCTLSTAEKFPTPQRIKRNSGRNNHNSGIINKNNNLLPIAFSSFILYTCFTNIFNVCEWNTNNY